MTTKVAGRIATAGVVFALTTIGSRAEEIELPTFDVVATTPLGGGDIDVAKSPFAVWQTSSQDIQTFNDTTLPDTLARQAPGVTVGNVSGNDFQPDLSYRGFDADIRAGSFGRAQEELQYGKQIGNYSVYVAATQINDGGWRVDGASQITNFYGDVGYKANGFESHLQLTAGDSQLGAGALTPIQELQSSWNSIYTVPQTTENKMAMLAWTGSYAYSPTLSFQGGAYFRAFNQAHVDGNSTDVEPCPPSSCLGDDTPTPVRDTFGNVIPDLSNGGTTDLGEIDRNWTQSRSLGASVQAVDTDKLAGHDNTLTVGASLDYGWTRFSGNSQLGIVPFFVNNSPPVTGLPLIIDEPDSFLNPISVHAKNTYTGLFALDTYSVNDRLKVTAGARFNYAGINLDGENGALLNGFSNFFHVNPTVGFTYKLTPDVNFYAGYAMTNRAPTPLELGCADPNNPCIIDNF